MNNRFCSKMLTTCNHLEGGRTRGAFCKALNASVAGVELAICHCLVLKDMACSSQCVARSARQNYAEIRSLKPHSRSITL